MRMAITYLSAIITSSKSDGLTRRLFDVDEYYRMAEAGIFSHEERVDLIRGVVVAIDHVSPAHAYCASRLNEKMVLTFHRLATVSVLGPVRLDRWSEVTPDLSILRTRREELDSHPGPQDISLIVEIADKTLEFDRRIKGPMYAEVGVSEYWIVNLLRNEIEAYRHPVGSAYESLNTYHCGDRFYCTTFPDIPIDVKEILG